MWKMQATQTTTWISIKTLCQTVLAPCRYAWRSYLFLLLIRYSASYCSSRYIGLQTSRDLHLWLHITPYRVWLFLLRILIFTCILHAIVWCLDIYNRCSPRCSPGQNRTFLLQSHNCSCWFKIEFSSHQIRIFHFLVKNANAKAIHLYGLGHWHLIL